MSTEPPPSKSARPISPSTPRADRISKVKRHIDEGVSALGSGGFEDLEQWMRVTKRRLEDHFGQTSQEVRDFKNATGGRANEQISRYMPLESKRHEAEAKIRALKTIVTVEEERLTDELELSARSIASPLAPPQETDTVPNFRKHHHLTPEELDLLANWRHRGEQAIYSSDLTREWSDTWIHEGIDLFTRLLSPRAAVDFMHAAIKDSKIEGRQTKKGITIELIGKTKVAYSLTRRTLEDINNEVDLDQEGDLTNFLSRLGTLQLASKELATSHPKMAIQWENVACALIDEVYTEPEASSQLKARGGGRFSADDNSAQLADKAEQKCTYLSSMHDTLTKHIAKKRNERSMPRLATKPTKVFIVHGHDETLKHETSDYLRKLKLEPIVLQNQVNGGRTIIEKFEKHAQESSYAIILLTPDDVASAKDNEDKAKARARQNVIFELGFFVGKLGRGNVCLLKKGDIEIPSDLFGVVYETADPAGAWKRNVAAEMKDAGLPVDLNNL